MIVFLFPHEGKFRYHYNENKPWSYGLLTAPFDFPIYKSALELQAEQDSILKTVKPYFRMNSEQAKTQINIIEERYNFVSEKPMSGDMKRFLERCLSEIYNKGVIADVDMNFIQQQGGYFMLFNDKGEAETHAIRNVYTPQTANDLIASRLPINTDMKEYIVPNLIYDKTFTEKVEQEEMLTISPSIGMIQAGEKIIDKGEIVTPRIFAILNSLKQIATQKGGNSQMQITTLGSIIVLVSGLMLCLLLYLIYLRKNIYANQKDTIFLLSMLAAFVILTELTITYELFSIYIIPYAIIPIVIRTFFDSRTAQMTHLIAVAICSLMVSAPYDFLLMQIIVCLVSIFVLKDLTQRSELIKCAFFILLTYVLVFLSFHFLQGGEFSKIDWITLVSFAINFLFVMFTYPFIYILEKIFGYISNVTLVELSDINRPALQALSENAPGTFQHSLQVSMLGTAAATRVGANPQLVRTGALYHDLGKMDNPAFFTENKIEGNNPHDNLTTVQSAKIITDHVPNGVKDAEKYNIPPAIIKFIETHHGKGKAKYFYNTYKNEHPGEEIDEEAFSYKGYNPDTKETAILMMADSVEAASRSLKDYNEESIRTLVNKIIDGQIADGLLSNAPLTFKNISAIKDVFVDKLLSVYHSRISYPELNK